VNLRLFWDTETQRLPLFDQPSEDERQPHLCSLAALLIEMETRRTVSSMNVTIRPDGWTIPAETTQIHGISTEYAMDVGVPESLALEMFLHMWDGRPRVAYNESFDARIIRIAMHRFATHGYEHEQWKDGPAECAMKMATPIVKIPSPKGNGCKWPKLSEAYKHFTGKDLVGAHSAMADTLACRDVFFAIKDNKP
jgi:DNA polymerase-3 subunit epsilon